MVRRATEPAPAPRGPARPRAAAARGSRCSFHVASRPWVSAHGPAMVWRQRGHHPLSRRRGGGHSRALDETPMRNEYGVARTDSRPSRPSRSPAGRPPARPGCVRVTQDRQTVLSRCAMVPAVGRDGLHTFDHAEGRPSVRLRAPSCALSPPRERSASTGRVELNPRPGERVS